MDQKYQRWVAALGLGVGGAFGMAGSFAPTATLRSVAWGIDGVALVIASALLVVIQLRKNRDFMAAGFLVFAIGQGLVLSTAGVNPPDAAPTFGAGASLWAAGLALVSASRGFPVVVRLLGLAATVLFAIVATQIFMGVRIDATSSPLPSLAYPLFVATMLGWIWSLLREK